MKLLQFFVWYKFYLSSEQLYQLCSLSLSCIFFSSCTWSVIYFVLCILLADCYHLLNDCYMEVQECTHLIGTNLSVRFYLYFPRNLSSFLLKTLLNLFVMTWLCFNAVPFECNDCSQLSIFNSFSIVVAT